MRGARYAIVVAAMSILALALAGPAAAETRVVNFDDLPAGTEVKDQYKEEDGVFFRGPGEGDGWFPLVKSVSGLAHSGDRVASIANCVGGGTTCEFFTPVSIGRLTKTASSVSAYVGWIELPEEPGSTASLRSASLSKSQKNKGEVLL
jgi:hypothetical protein